MFYWSIFYYIIWKPPHDAMALIKIECLEKKRNLLVQSRGRNQRKTATNRSNTHHYFDWFLTCQSTVNQSPTDSMRVHVFWRRGFEGERRGEGGLCTFKIACRSRLSKISYPTFKIECILKYLTHCSYSDYSQYPHIIGLHIKPGNHTFIFHS